MKALQFSIAILALSTLLAILGCGDSRQLQSITIEPASITAQNGQAQFTAAGHFNKSPMTVTPLPVTWLQRGPALDPPGPGYSLTTDPGTARCFFPGTTYTMVAYAPQNPNAPSSGTMDFAVFSDVAINHTTSQEGGFVAATAQAMCL